MRIAEFKDTHEYHMMMVFTYKLLRLKISIIVLSLKNLFLEKFTETQIIANAFGIFTAGFETVSSTICYCLYELALNKDIQDRVRQEVQLKLSNNDGKINKEFLLDLHYLDMVIAGDFLL